MILIYGSIVYLLKTEIKSWKFFHDINSSRKRCAKIPFLEIFLKFSMSISAYFYLPQNSAPFIKKRRNVFPIFISRKDVKMFNWSHLHEILPEFSNSLDVWCSLFSSSSSGQNIQNYSAISSTFQTTSALPVAISMQIFPESLLSGKADVKVVIESVKYQSSGLLMNYL